MEQDNPELFYHNTVIAAESVMVNIVTLLSF